MKVKNLDVLKIVEQNQQNIYDRKTEKNKPTETLISNRKKDIKAELIHEKTYTGQHRTRSKERHKD